MQKNDYVVIGISAGMHTIVWKCQINYQMDFKLIIFAIFAHNFPYVLRNCVCSRQCWKLLVDPKLYIPSTLNIDVIMCHLQSIVDAVKC